jgi:hypothetical protein
MIRGRRPHHEGIFKTDRVGSERRLGILAHERFGALRSNRDYKEPHPVLTEGLQSRPIRKQSSKQEPVEEAQLCMT